MCGKPALKKKWSSYYPSTRRIGPSGCLLPIPALDVGFRSTHFDLCSRGQPSIDNLYKYYNIMWNTQCTISLQNILIIIKIMLQVMLLVSKSKQILYYYRSLVFFGSAYTPEKRRKLNCW